MGNLAGVILDAFAGQAEVTEARIVYPPNRVCHTLRLSGWSGTAFHAGRAVANS